MVLLGTHWLCTTTTNGFGSKISTGDNLTKIDFETLLYMVSEHMNVSRMCLLQVLAIMAYTSSISYSSILASS